MILGMNWVVPGLQVVSAGVSHVDTVSWRLYWAARSNRAAHMPGVLVLTVGWVALVLGFMTFLLG